MPRTKRDKILADLTKARQHFVRLRGGAEFDKRYNKWKAEVCRCRIGMASIENNGWTSLSDDLSVILLDAILKTITDIQSQTPDGMEVGTWE